MIKFDKRFILLLLQKCEGDICQDDCLKNQYKSYLLIIKRKVLVQSMLYFFFSAQNAKERSLGRGEETHCRLHQGLLTVIILEGYDMKQEEKKADIEETERWKLGKNITISIVDLGYIRSSSISRLDTTIDFVICHQRSLNSIFA